MDVKDFEAIERENNLNNFSDIVNNLNSALEQYIYVVNQCSTTEDISFFDHLELEIWYTKILNYKEQLENWHEKYSGDYTVDELLKAVKNKGNSLMVNEMLKNLQIVNYAIMEK